MGITVKGFTQKAKINAVNGLPPEAIAAKYNVPITDVVRGIAETLNPNFVLPGLMPATFRFIRFEATANNGGTYGAVGDINFIIGGVGYLVRQVMKLGMLLIPIPTISHQNTAGYSMEFPQ